MSLQPSKKKRSKELFLLRFLKSPVQTILEEKTLLKFMIVGASGTVVNLGVLYLLHGLLGLVYAQAAGIEISIFNNFVWNDSFTFKTASNENNPKGLDRVYRFMKYNTLSLGTATLNLSIFYILTYPMGFSHGYLYLGSSAVAILVAFVFNYFGSSRWAWKKRYQTLSTTRDIEEKRL